MYTIAKIEGLFANHPEHLNYALSEFQTVLRIEHQGINTRYNCVDWIVVIFRGDYHASTDPKRHLTARGYKTSTGRCHWGLHIYEDGSYTIVADNRKQRGRGRKELADITYEFVWAESQNDTL